MGFYRWFKHPSLSGAGLGIWHGLSAVDDRSDLSDLHAVVLARDGRPPGPPVPVGAGEAGRVGDVGGHLAALHAYRAGVVGGGPSAPRTWSS